MYSGMSKSIGMINGMESYLVLHNEFFKCFLEGDPWTEAPGIPLGIVHLGSKLT